ncbi:MAG: hypothetical protein QOC59_1669 [Microbacteriaceae bacterium]|nr:hypothetical protein [Microbacteriaceae bacterium]
MDDVPTDEQLRRIEDRVMGRIRRRARLPRQIGATVVVAGLVVGGFALVRPVGNTSGSASGGGSAAGSIAVVARCHSGSTTRSTSVVVPLSGTESATAAIAACLKAEEEGRLRAADRSTLAKTDPGDRFVVCRDRKKVLQVFVKDRTPSTLCKRNGMVAP